MTYLLHHLVADYNQFLASRKDSIVDSWMFTDSPTWIVGVVLLYLYFVLKLGPEFMSKRSSYKLKNTLLLYNAVQVIFNLWLFTFPFRVEGMFTTMYNICDDSQSAPYFSELTSGAAWWYMISKVLDLCDTVFFVLRKKQSHITFLHVWHHTIMATFSWLILKYLPGTQVVFVAIMNTLVHVIMYTYYLIAALGPQAQKYLWWKKYLTLIQMIQFLMVISYFGYIIRGNCGASRMLTYIGGSLAIMFLCLFLNYYRHEYKKEKKS